MSMNISPHIPQVVANSAAPATESLAKANVMREIVPPTSEIEAIVSQKSREQDVRPPINQSSATYEDIQLNRNNSQIIPSNEEEPQGEQSSDQSPDKDSESSRNGASGSNSEQVKQAGEENATDEATNERSSREQAEKQAQDQQEKEQEQLDAQQIQQLQQRDSEVRAHEQAHAAIGGSYAGSPSYEYQTGPNGKKYAVGGEVSIDVSKEATPEETIRKMQTVHAAALAPAEPSSQDRKVAAQAIRNIADARAEVVQQNGSSSNSSNESKTENSQDANTQVKATQSSSRSSDNTSNSNVEIPSQMSLAKDEEQNINSSLFESKAAQVISNKYASSTVPHTQGFNAVA